MSSLFDSPDIPSPPPPPPPPPPPVVEDAQVKAESDMDQLRRRRGRASTVLTGENSTAVGDNSAPMTTAARLLGA